MVYLFGHTRGEPVEVLGEGTQSREMTYVSDVVDTTAAALAAEPEGAARVYNVGGGARTTVVELVELVGEVMGERVRIRYAPPVPWDVHSTWADLERAAQELGLQSAGLPRRRRGGAGSLGARAGRP